LHFNSSASKIQDKPKRSNRVETVSGSDLIATVDVDSLNEKILVMKNKRAELEKEQRSIEVEWENGYRGLELQKNKFLERGKAFTQAEAEEFQGQLIRQQQAIDANKQSRAGKLTDKYGQFMDDFQKELKSFINEYNKDGKFKYILTVGGGLDYMLYKDSTLDITSDVIVGMNERLEGGKKK
jgi:Skp family chaperone for outer membrane proteins